MTHERGEGGEARLIGPLEAGVEQAEGSAAQHGLAAGVVDGDVGPLAGLDHGRAQLVVADADRDLLGPVVAAELGEALDDGLGLVARAVGDDQLMIGDVDDAAGPEGPVEAAVGVEAVDQRLRGVDQGRGPLAVRAQHRPLDPREVDDADQHQAVAGVDGHVGVDETGDRLMTPLVRVDASAPTQALAVAIAEPLEHRPAQRLALHVHAGRDLGDVAQAQQLAGQLLDDAADLRGELVPGGPVLAVGSRRQERGDLLGGRLTQHVHPRERALEGRGGVRGRRDQLVDHGPRGQHLRGDQPQASRGALGQQGVQEQLAGAGPRQHATDLPQVAALPVAMLADEPGGRRGQQRSMPVQPLPVHDQDPARVAGRSPRTASYAMKPPRARPRSDFAGPQVGHGDGSGWSLGPDRLLDPGGDDR